MIRAFALLALLVAACASVQAQGAPADSARGLPSAQTDTTQAARIRGVPLAPPAPGGLDEPVAYTARDSVRIEVARPIEARTDTSQGDVVTLYGNARATYRTATVTAAALRYSGALQTIRASPADSDSGAVGIPQFEDGDESFTGRQFTYNLQTRRGRVVAARTAIQDGYLLGGVIKQADIHTVYVANAAYTTCELDHPHYALEAGRLKVVDGERVYTGPVRLRLLGIALPLVLPFGYFPAAEGRRSGPLPFRYGRETGYGLFLDNVGWYWAISDYFDATASGKLGTEGSFLGRGQIRYNRLYAYNGTLSVEAGRLRQGESTDPNYAPRIPSLLQWQHQQEFAAGPRLGASVNLQSVSQRLVADAVSQQITQSTSSSINLQQTWPRVGRSLSLNAQANQDFVGNRTTVTLPTARFAQQRRFPFRRGRDEGAFEKISVSYTAQATNTLAYSPLAGANADVGFFQALFDAEAFRTATGQPSRFDTRVEQTIPVQATYAVPRVNLALTPSLQYTEILASRTTNRVFDAQANTLSNVQVGGLATARTLTASLTAATELYGTFGLRAGPVDGIRHTVRPRASLSYQPDYARFFNQVREVQADSTGRTVRFAPVSGVPIDPTRSLSFGVENAVLARLVSTDSTGEQTRRSVQVLSLDVQGGYNFAADERPVRDLTLDARSQFYGASARLAAGYSAYALDEVGSLTTDSYLAATGRPLRLTSLTASVSRTFGGRASGAFGNPQGGTPGGALRPVTLPRSPAEVYDPTRDTRPAVVGYLDAAAPLSFALDVTASLRPAIGLAPSQTTATLNVTQFNVRLTPLWTATGSTGLDLITFEPTTTRLALRRDLHCWEMSVDWQPIGIARGFAVSLYVKSGYLRDILRLDAPRTTVRNLPF